MKKGLTAVFFILDRSGSMSPAWSDVVGGYKTFIKEQKEEEGECRFSLAAFDDKYDLLWDYVDIQEVDEELRVSPRGMTRLLDAFGKSINSLGESLAKEKEENRPEKVLLVIQTDGFENDSKEFSRSQIKEMITHQKEKYNWDFLFLGANEDCLDIAKDVGIGANCVSTYSSGDSMVSGLSCKTVSYRSTGVAEFSHEEREVLNK